MTYLDGSFLSCFSSYSLFTILFLHFHFPKAMSFLEPIDGVNCYQYLSSFLCKFHSFFASKRKQTLRTQYVKSQYLHSKAVAIYTSLSTNSFTEAINNNNCQLRKLNLSVNNISDIGAQHLAEVFNNNCQLCKLNLFANDTTEAGEQKARNLLSNSRSKCELII